MKAEKSNKSIKVSVKNTPVRKVVAVNTSKPSRVAVKKA